MRPMKTTRPTAKRSESKMNVPCAGCKLLRRRCTEDCIFVPYFPPTEPEKFAGVHRVFGASNVSKMLQVSAKLYSFIIHIIKYLLVTLLTFTKENVQQGERERERSVHLTCRQSLLKKKSKKLQTHNLSLPSYL